MPENKTFTDQLKVVFTEDELRQKGLLLAQTMGEVDHIESEKKSVAADYKGKIEAKLTDIKKLKDQINNGSDYLPVKCEVHFNSPSPGIKQTYRMDTGELISTEDMTGSERQLKITDLEVIEQADAPFGTVTENPVEPEETKTPNEDDLDKMTPERYTAEDFVKEFQNLTAALDADKFQFPKGKIKKVADQTKVKVLRQDNTGTVFTLGESEVIFFDDSVFPDVYTSIEIIDGRIEQLNKANEAEPESPGLKEWKKEVKDLKKKRKLLSEVPVKDPEVIPPGEGDQVNLPVEKTEKKPAKPKRNIYDVFAIRPAEWFIERIGKDVEAKNPDPNQFSGVMKIDDQEHAEYLAGVSQNESKFTYRDIQKAG